MLPPDPAPHLVVRHRRPPQEEEDDLKRHLQMPECSTMALHQARL
jgi:hypothetical protein